jgi:hypothetical protein
MERTRTLASYFSPVAEQDSKPSLLHLHRQIQSKQRMEVEEANATNHH